MILTEFKEEKQRDILKRLGERLTEIAEQDDALAVELTLNCIQDGYLDFVQNEYGDFFGSEGWQHWLGLD